MVHLFSIIMILFFLYNITRKASINNKYITQTAFTVFIYIFVNRGYFIESDALNVDNWQGALLLEFFMILLIHKGVRVSKRLLEYLAALMTSTALLIIIPASHARTVGAAGAYEQFMSGQYSYMVPTFSKLTVFFLVLAIIHAYVIEQIAKKFNYNDYGMLFSKLSNYIHLLAFVGLIELVVKNIFHSNLYNSVMVFVFGEGTSTYNSLVLRGSGFMLTGFNRECSHFAYAMVIGIVILFTNYIRCKKKNELVWILICAILISFSGAFTIIPAFGFLGCLWIIYLLYKDRKAARKFIKGVCIVALVLLLGAILSTDISRISSEGYIVSRLNEALNTIGIIFTSSDSYYSLLPMISSSTTRIYSIIDTFKQFFYRPIFGLGIATTYCHGPSISTLVEIGVVGFYCMLNVYFKKFLSDFNTRKISVLLIVVWILSNTIMGSSTRLYVSMDGFIIIASGCYILNTLRGNHRGV